MLLYVFLLFLKVIATDAIKVDDYRKCPPLKQRDHKPKNVRDLRPDDIEVIMAMGDSLTAGLNSRVHHPDTEVELGLFPSSHSGKEFRGGSWITGADPDSSSIGSIVSHYNPSISGLSRGNSSFLYCFGPVCPAGKKFPYEPAVMGLNAAQSGSWTTLYNTFNQLRYLDTYYKSFIPKSMGNPWKLLFMEFGFNNICSGCIKLTRAIEFSVKHFDYHIRSVLEEIRARYSKIFITMVGPFNISRLEAFARGFEDCRKIMDSKFPITCVCNSEKVVGIKGKQKMDDLATAYNVKLAEIAKDYQSRNYEDFTVVYDPSLGYSNISGGTKDLISGADCFHPSVKSHNIAAVQLWNNMFKPQNQKSAIQLPSELIIECPDAINSISNLTCTKLENDLDCLSREELIQRLQLSDKELHNKARDLIIAAEIGQQLLQANQSLRHAYDELLYSDRSSEAVNGASTPTKSVSKMYLPLSPSPKKNQKFDMMYVESLEKNNHDLSQEVDRMMRQMAHTNRHNQKLTKDLEICMQELNGLRQQLSTQTIHKHELSQKDDSEMIEQLKNKLQFLESENMDLISQRIIKEKEWERASRDLQDSLEREELLKNEINESKKLLDQVGMAKGKIMSMQRDTRSLEAKVAVATQTVDKSIEKESLTFFRSLAFIHSTDSSAMEVKKDQLFIPCKFPTSPTAMSRTRTLHKDDWVLEISEDLSLDHSLRSSIKPNLVPFIPRQDRLRVLIGQFINYVYDLVL